jgi:hypothetical protein
MGVTTATPIRVSDVRRAAGAELVFNGVEQAGESFEGRVFLNNVSADEGTPTDSASGYVGSFHVFGYGEAAPAAMREAKERRAAGAGAIAPIEKRVPVDPEALARAGSDELAVTVVTVPADPGGAVPDQAFERVELVVDRGAGHREPGAS